MALTYNALNRQWNNVQEKTDNPIYDLEGMLPTNQANDYWAGFATPIALGYRPTANDYQTFRNKGDSDRANAATNQQREASNQQLARINAENTTLNELNTKKNNVYNKVVATASTARKGDYLSQRKTIRELDIDETTRKELETSYRQFYVNEKLDKWDPALTAKPLYGNFDVAYYKKNNQDVEKAWQKFVADDDVDIVERYGENGFYANHYTNQGKKENRRANAAEIAEETKKYKELKKTDAEIQEIREKQLNLDPATQSSRLMGEGSAILAAWTKAKEGDSYWVNQGREKFLDITKKEDFFTLFRLSDRPEDKEVFKKAVGSAGGISELENEFNSIVSENELIETKKFSALTQDVLKQTIAEMKKAKGKEQMLSVLGGFGGFSEIMNINQELSNSIMGDSGVGGILSQMGSAGRAEDALEKKLQGITGVRNNATYNWQQWFDKTLKTRYEKDIELGYTAGAAEEKIKIESDFARTFIDTYLNPRFNTSRSMDEFVEYIDVRQEEENPFQTQSRISALKMTADLRTQSYLNAVKAQGDRSFDTNFYFNPTGDKARLNAYKDQALTVTQDWEEAKRGNAYWAQQAYRFGIDINNKEDFARIHFQVKGQGKGYDGADDIVNASKVRDEIYNKILPALKLESDKQGSVFGIFTTPEEFADEILKGLNPEDTAAWDEVLKRFGLTNFKGTLDELKQYIQETFRTGSAQTIRENIKYLNDKRKEPTQQNLGLTYIQRAEDYKTKQPAPDTELFKTFQSSGYQGSEEEFYKNFFPDLDRSEQALLTKSGRDNPLKTSGLDLSDPFASLGTIESFLGGDEEPDKVEKEEEKAEPSSNFFRIGLGDEKEDDDYKSKTGSQILGEFTSMFKGL